MVYINTTGKHNEVWLDKPYATITVECPDCPSTEDAYNSGWTDGSEDGYHKGYQSGRTDGYDDGWGPGYDSGYTDGLEACSGGSCEGVFESGYTAGEAAQKAKLSALTITSDWGNYTNENGWSSVTVNVPMKKWLEESITENGRYTYDTPYPDYEGYKAARITVNVPDHYNEGYTSGYTDGLNACSGGNEDLIANLQGDYYVIPEGTTRLRDNAFYYVCFSPITIPNSVTAIGAYAFQGNDCLETITIPDSVTSIGIYAFANCGSLTAVILGSGCTSLPRNMFANSYNLTGMTIPGTITNIEDAAFRGCSSLNHLTFEGLVPPTLAKISGTTASLGSTDYTFPIYVPCQSLQAYKTAFGQYYEPRIMCNSGTSGVSILDFIYETTSPNEKINLFTGDAQYTNSFFKAFYSAITFMEIDGVVVYPNPADIEIYQGGGEDRINLYTHTFAQSGSHTVKFYMDKSFSASTRTGTKYPAYELTELIFASNSNIKCPITEATIGDGYEYVHMGVFQGSDILTSATIPSSVTAITNFVFENSALKILTCNRITHPSLGVDVFDGANSLKRIYVPASAVEDYKEATNWSNYSSIISAIQ